MKVIGMLGGMSWESTVSYYQAVNLGVKKHLGGLHSAKVCLSSVDFHEIEQLQHQGNWQKTASILIESAKSTEAAGADFLIICTNTMHKVVDEIEANISIPVLHIADATAKALVADGIGKVGLLGTRFTMEQDFYKQRLVNHFGIDVIVPDGKERSIIHDVIYNQLCQGIIDDHSREQYLTIINGLYEKGAEAVILGCTEIALLVQQAHTHIPLYDTAEIHAQEAVRVAICDSITV